ncbi:Precorrin-2 dehydrogenase [Poriferisphaera corsica]|uniref:precorrin-2 dehydrogenase n=1 Tax=Poriferisphaera corsica TaxID=2528020 RepID=A0A517YTZ1_9BACT|nr:bifunctional precorrin-2 dehydrogenase/sirohydrochlorin ferrochelatase [Poriferisphaera corsica]QDU33704.1 Precorrin-2 dehydrogenase [Poriferisphaera corsica]
MPDFPIMLNLRTRNVIIIGGGGVALRRAKSLLEAEATVTVVAPNVTPELAALPIELHQRNYQCSDLHGMFLVVIATNDPKVNEMVHQDARAEDILVNRADSPEQSDFIVPAVAQVGPVTLAVSTSGASASAAAQIRDQLETHLDRDWSPLLTLASKYRHMLQSTINDPKARIKRIKELTNADAVRVFKEQGAQAYQAFCQSLMPDTNEDDQQDS